jgi:ureidoacrylate peracid hydrolase
MEATSGRPADTHPDGSASGTLGLEDHLDPATTAIVVVDVQRLFTDILGAALDPPLDAVRTNLSTLLAEARHAGATVVLVRSVIAPDEHSNNTRQWPDFMRENMEPGSPGTEFDPCIVRSAGDIEVIKKRYSAFVGTPLESVLRERGIATVVVAGLTTNVCVQSTVRDAWQRDYLTITLSDCCSEMGPGAHDTSLAWNARNFGHVCTSAEVVEAWHAQV